MRNQWVEVNVSSSKTQVATGPRSKSDNMKIDLYQDNKGSSEHMLNIVCYAEVKDGKTICRTEVYNKLTGECIFEHESER